MNNKKAVFFLGAGFSKAIIPSFPTLQELTKEINLRYRGEKGSVTKHFYDEIPKQYKKNIEYLLTFLSSNLPFKTEVQISTDDALYKDLKNRIVDYFENQNYQFTLSNELEKLCSYIRDYNITSITLNYDLLLERILAFYINNDSQDYNFFYHASIAPLFLRKDPNIEQNIYGIIDKLPSIIKLHGSINWFYAGISQIDPVFCKKQYPNSEYDYLSKDLQPMIVPPIMDKTSIYNHTILKAIWRQAFDELRTANEIYICGFSFPETDLSIRFLFQSALEKNNDLQKIYFINTGTDLENKIKHFKQALTGYEDKLNFTYCCENSLNRFIEEIIIPSMSNEENSHV